MKKKLVELTPTKYRCGTVSPHCPAVFKSDARTYVIIGKVADHTENKELYGRIGSGEIAIEISADLIEGAISNSHK